jgi:MarR family transcriptional regulator, organic hydroperoxide resistance regulator
MTDTQVPPPPFGQTVGEAQTALKTVLDRVLDKAGTTFDSWVALNTLATQGPAIAGDELRSNLAQALRTDAGAISELVERLRSSGLVRLTADGGSREGALVELTEEGQVLHRSLRRSVGGASAELLAGLDPSDVETTIRVLREVTERAKAPQPSRAS